MLTHIYQNLSEANDLNISLERLLPSGRLSTLLSALNLEPPGHQSYALTRQGEKLLNFKPKQTNIFQCRTQGCTHSVAIPLDFPPENIEFGNDKE